VITANSHTAHRIDTALHGGRDTRLTEADLDARIADKTWTPRQVVPTQRTWPIRLWRAITRPIRRRFLEWRERCVREEREEVTKRLAECGCKPGPTYLRNCERQERDYRSRLSFLDME